MKYVSKEYQETLDNLATLLMRPIGDAALQDTVEFDAVILDFPTGLHLKNPPEHGWELPPAA